MSRYFISALIASLIAIAAAPPALAQTPNPPYYGPMHGEWMWSMMGSGFMWIMPLVFLIALVALIAVAARLIAPRHAGDARPGQASAAGAVLDTRYARGEIGREEYLEKKKDLAGA